MTRAFFASALSLAIPFAGSVAPLVHAHPGGRTAHHDGPTVHAHVSGHAHSHHTGQGHLPGHEPAIDDADRDSAVFVQLFVAVEALTFELPIALPQSPVRPADAESAAYRSVLVTHTHDPPFLRSQSTRAPPSFLA